jgi:hypothetical protein
MQHLIVIHLKLNGMKKFYVILLVILGTISLSAVNCNVSSSSSQQDDGTQKKEVRTVDKFDGIDLGTSADVKLTQGTPQSVTIEGRARDVEKIITEIDGSNLQIRTQSGSWNMKKVTIYITMEHVKELHVSGSGSIVAQTPINGNNLAFHVSGSGSIEIGNLKAANLSSHISGSGSIKLSGKEETKMHEMHISGSGDVNVTELPTQEVTVHISGSGDCRVNASNKLVARVSGSGSVYYSGKPVVDANVSGSGKIKEISM